MRKELDAVLHRLWLSLGQLAEDLVSAGLDRKITAQEIALLVRDVVELVAVVRVLAQEVRRERP